MLSHNFGSLACVCKWGFLLPLQVCRQWSLLWSDTEETVLKPCCPPWWQRPADHTDKSAQREMSLTLWSLHDKLTDHFLLCLLLTHPEFGACHCRQLTFLANSELIGPGPVGNALCPSEVVPILNHICYHFVVSLGIEKSCEGAGIISRKAI